MIRQLLLVLFACAAGVHLARAEPGTAGAARLPAESHQHASSASSSNLLAGNANSVAWFVQLSDLHINKWVHHEILPDLQEFGQRVLTGVRPGALLITGDLVDAKTRPEGSQQHEEEWQAYERAWRQLAQSAQLPASAILDLRGNHDVFDTLRNSPQDWFATHSAAAAAHGRQAAATQRLWLSTLPGQLLLQPQQQHSRKQRRGSGSAGERRQLLQQQGTGVGNSSNSSSSAHSAQKLRSAGRAVMAAADAAAAACPAALLLGIDLAPNIGLHSPTNFFGVAGPALLQQLQQRLQQLRSSSSSSSSGIADVALPAGCSTSIPIISYSHYPFSTVAAAYGSSSGVADGGGAPAVQGGRALRDLLCRHDVAAHLSGHLHDLLGPRMQVLYDKGALLGGVFGRSRLRAPPLTWHDGAAGAGGGAGGAFLADLEVGVSKLCLVVLYDKAALLGGVFGRSRLRAPPLHWQDGAAGGHGGGAFLADLEVGVSYLCLAAEVVNWQGAGGGAAAAAGGGAEGGGAGGGGGGGAFLAALETPLHWQGAAGAGGANGGAGGGGGGAFLADLESANWKQRRRWRLMVVDCVTDKAAAAAAAAAAALLLCYSRPTGSSGGAGG
uniref:Calcineurin-like phosphoesterase domain-containing protein n=1 Tax=Tetradesmus obliquus TaxID=3088 RepID=A0A383VD17_TETOB|eukprot:jgi/Sobl393_1/14872/SZX62266.1